MPALQGRVPDWYDWPSVMRELRLPPVFDPYPLDREDPFAWARMRAGELGAGAFAYAATQCELRCATVFEPDPAGPPAFGALLAACLAFGDALGSLGPPNLVLHHDWPATLRVGGAVVGGLDLAVGPAGPDMPDRPDWMVVGASVVLALSGARAADPGLDPDSTALAEEGFEIEPEILAESYARYLLNRLSLFQETGFAGLRGEWLARWPGRGRQVALVTPGGRVEGEAAGVDGQGALLLAGGRRVAIEEIIAGESR
jgi:BirA family transcriptional regulator, biotin operon repressor / biotin---[acetyl-CoA-carboxylase] ligase